MGYSVCLIGYSVCQMGYSVCLMGYSVCQMGYSVCQMGYSVCQMGYSVCQMGYSVCQMGYSVCQMGYSVCQVGYSVCQMVYRLPLTRSWQVESLTKRSAIYLSSPFPLLIATASVAIMHPPAPRKDFTRNARLLYVLGSCSHPIFHRPFQERPQKV